MGHYSCLTYVTGNGNCQCSAESKALFFPHFWSRLNRTARFISCSHTTDTFHIAEVWFSHFHTKTFTSCFLLCSCIPLMCEFCSQIYIYYLNEITLYKDVKQICAYKYVENLIASSQCTFSSVCGANSLWASECANLQQSYVRLKPSGPLFAAKLRKSEKEHGRVSQTLSSAL